MENSDSLSLNLARWASSLRYEDLPQATVHHVKRSLLDYLGVAIGGSTTRIARAVQAQLLATEGVGSASVLGTDHKLSPSNAALVNGTAATVLELDGGHARASIHVEAACIPALLSMAEAEGASGRDIILATAAAYEIASRLGIGAANATAKGFNGTSLLGVFGAASGVAKILGCDTDKMASALGLAGSNAGGLFDYHGGWLDSWSLNVGRVCREGLLCAALAEHGMPGPIDILDGPRGIGALFGDGPINPDTVLDKLGQEWAMLETYFKIYPCCRFLHAPIDAALAVREKVGAGIERIERIVIETSAEAAHLQQKYIGSVMEAQFSIPFGVAAAFVYGAANLEHFEEAAFKDPKTLRLLDRIELVPSEDPRIANRRMAARVSALIDNAWTGAIVDEPYGNPGNPLSDSALEKKFLSLATPITGREAAGRIGEAVWNLDRENGGTELFAQLT